MAVHVAPVGFSENQHGFFAISQIEIACSNIWQAMLLVYQHALAAARTDPRVQAAIAPFAAFMKKRARKNLAKPTTPLAA